MWDKRVVRGNTYAQHTLPAAAQPDPIEIQRQQEQRRRIIARRRAKEQLRPRSPDPVDGKNVIILKLKLSLFHSKVVQLQLNCEQGGSI